MRRVHAASIRCYGLVGFLCLVVVVLTTSVAIGQATGPPSLPPSTLAPPAPPVVEDLGNERYRIDTIEIDKAQQRFTVPALVLRDKPPLEFLAVAKKGLKAYESLLELQTSAVAFNVACLLISLDPAKGKAPSRHFDPEPAQGESLDLWVSWEQDGQIKQVDAADLLQLEGQTMPRGEWVYTGSVFLPDGRFQAQLDGTVIGFVHAPSSLIEHRTGFGMGKFGSIIPTPGLLPPVGSQVKLIVARRDTERK